MKKTNFAKKVLSNIVCFRGKEDRMGGMGRLKLFEEMCSKGQSNSLSNWGCSSWWSSCFRHQRSVVRIQSLANFYIKHFDYCQMY